MTGPFLTYILEGPKPPQPQCWPPPTEGFWPPPVKVPFGLKISEYLAEIAGNQVQPVQNYKNFLRGIRRPSKKCVLRQPFSSAHVIEKSLIVLGPSTEKFLKKALTYDVE